MKIVVVTTASLEGLGGDGRVAREFAEVLAREDEVLLVLSGDKNQEASQSPNLTHFFVSGVSKGLYILPRLTPSSLRMLHKALRDFSPNIIHMHDQGPVPFITLLWALKHGVPVVYTCHTIPSEVVSFGLSEIFPKAKKLFDNRIFESYLDLFLKKASAIIAINKTILEDLRNKKIETPVYSICNGRNLDLYNKVGFPEISENPKKLLFIGFLSQRKNQKFLLEAMLHLPKEGYQLDFIGIPLEERYLQELKGYAEKLGVTANFLGAVDHKRIPSYLESAHFFISASLMEVQSLAIIEALASGTPVISLNNETTRELVDETNGFNFSQDTSAEMFAKKITEYANLSQEDYEKKCLNARDRVSHMDWSMVREKTSEVYTSLLLEQSREGRNKFKDLLKGIPKEILNVLNNE